LLRKEGDLFLAASTRQQSEAKPPQALNVANYTESKAGI